MSDLVFEIVITGLIASAFIGLLSVFKIIKAQQLRPALEVEIISDTYDQHEFDIGKHVFLICKSDDYTDIGAGFFKTWICYSVADDEWWHVPECDFKVINY